MTSVLPYGFPFDVIAHYAGSAAIGFARPVIIRYGSGLSVSVGSQKTEQLARLHIEAYLIHSNEEVKPLYQIFDFDSVNAGLLEPNREPCSRYS